MNNLSQTLQTEHAITDASSWLRANQCVIKLPDQVYHKGKHVGTLNVVDGKLVFVPSITAAEWERASRLHPIPHELERLL